MSEAREKNGVDSGGPVDGRRDMPGRGAGDPWLHGDRSARGLPVPGGVALAVVAALVGLLAAQWLPPLAEWFGGAGPSTSVTATADADGEELWTCSMHPQVLEHEPGPCPICGMDLVPLAVDQAPVVESFVVEAGSGDADLWTCGMHPQVLEHEPGSCPICGMDLVPVSGSAVTAQSTRSAAGVVEIDPAVVQQMNVRTERVVRSDLSRQVRTVGYLDFDQERMVTVTTKTPGWIEKVHVNYVGEKVEQGQALFEIYSPELVQTQRELLSALEFAGELENAPEDARRRAGSLVEAARTRLGYWDLTPEQIARLEQTGEVFRTLEVASPASGVVMKRMPGLEGMAVRPGMELFHLADLRSLWLSVEVFEDQVATVRPGTQARITLAYFPGEVFRGRVRFLEPELSEQTRTVRALIELPNPGGRLRKGMFATVMLEPLEARDVLVVSQQAVLRTGRRQVVVVAEGNGRFAPREVVLGREAQGLVEVLEGLDEGEIVVTSAQFLIDSESRLREAVQKMVAERAGTSEGASGESSGASPTRSDGATPPGTHDHGSH